MSHAELSCHYAVADGTAESELVGRVMSHTQTRTVYWPLTVPCIRGYIRVRRGAARGRDTLLFGANYPHIYDG